MLKSLVIVESPGKIKKISECLGDNYIVKASYGHCRDLDSKTLSIDINNNFSPYYVVIPSKRRTVNELKALTNECSEVILAADEDREGEMIASSLADLLGLKDPKRIVFHEITKKAIKKAIENPTKINYDMVYAQQARRLLDRLVGYKISPILWKKLAGCKSAGRVQSVVVKIILEKENEIRKSISNPYLKSSGIFMVKNKKINTTLMKRKELYKYSSFEKAEKYINKITDEAIFKIKETNIKDSIRKAPRPFITSTLQQDSSTKLHFNVKKTMMVAQKLYEAGLITYMRTDSTNLSEDAQNMCKEYILGKYGKKYCDIKNFKSKSKGAQEAHEAIRPTKIKVTNLNNRMDKDCERLYNLIWKRTLASQMSNAIIEVQTIKIDGLKNDKSVLPKKTLFVGKLENVKFDGFLKLYNNYDNENDSGKIKIKKDDTINFTEIKVVEEYTKPPLRFNEAGLIKHLEKNGIGRPSTYASIISKVIERNYVETKNIEGVKKNSRVISINNKYKIKKSKKEIVIGKEKNKIVPTNMGEQVTGFLLENFQNLMDINFTVKFEKNLDKIADGKAKWFNVLDEYYKSFNPMVEKLMEEFKHLKEVKSEDVLLGVNPNNNLEIYKGKGKYGPYVKMLESKDSDKWRFASINGIDEKNLTVEVALNLLKYPKLVGLLGTYKIYLHKGQYGLYLKKGSATMPIKDQEIEESDINIKYAKELFEKGDPYAIKTFKIKNKNVYLKKGNYGYYLQVKGKKTKNLSLPNNIDEDKINLEYVLEYIGKKIGTKKSYRKKD